MLTNFSPKTQIIWNKKEIVKSRFWSWSRIWIRFSGIKIEYKGFERSWDPIEWWDCWSLSSHLIKCCTEILALSTSKYSWCLSWAVSADCWIFSSANGNCLAEALCRESWHNAEYSAAWCDCWNSHQEHSASADYSTLNIQHSQHHTHHSHH